MLGNFTGRTEGYSDVTVETIPDPDPNKWIRIQFRPFQDRGFFMNHFAPLSLTQLLTQILQ